ncbi:hypothetical protein [Zeaxanthinibacter enoshimensis]|uniref:Integron Cassette Protein Hfx-Cass5 domain-containing protein n=1 Tax=Zeaxanthinibacter enoshimensis TaxID=392009 RepID=A0A4R6TEX9_9FLAO|nr:hypothetical protein [Zeaxanthinibacter enoshimensis]TDQ28138.1 hypothetical protein CLV82_2980 [Zeaxanthinibacter enoshimensis]
MIAWANQGSAPNNCLKSIRRIALTVVLHLKKETDKIKRVEIDEIGQLLIFPETLKFPMVYRTATEVHWDPECKCLYSPRPSEWTYFDWYNHILEVVQNEGNYKLKLTDRTEWKNIPKELKTEIMKERKTKHNNGYEP